MAHVEAVGPERDGGARHLPHHRPRQGLHGRRTYRGAPRAPSRALVGTASTTRRPGTDTIRTTSEPRSIVAAPSASPCVAPGGVRAAHEVHDRRRHGRVGDDQQVDRADTRAAQRLEDRRSRQGRPAARRRRARPRRRRRRATGPRPGRPASRSGAGAWATTTADSDRRRARPRRPGGGAPGRDTGHDDDRQPAGQRRRPGGACSSPSGACAVRSATSSSHARASRVGWCRSSATGVPADAGDQAAGEAPDHDEPGHRDAEEVGRQRRDGDRAEGGQQHGRHPELRGEGDAGGLAEGGGAGEGRRQRAGRARRWRRRRTRRAGSRPSARASGSISTSAVTASPTTRSREIGTPGIARVAASAAIAEARSTDGSKRVITPKSPITTRVAPSRGQRRRRRSSGPASARANATF